MLLLSVILEIGKLVVTFAALLTRVQFRLGVNPFVQSPFSIPDERGRAELALEGAISEMDLIFVQLSIAAFEVSFIAEFALKRFLLGVGQLVRVIDISTGEGLWTESTLERPEG